MDNIGDWLYIIFLIIAAISGMRSSNKNKKKRQGRKDARRPKSDTAQPAPQNEATDETETAEDFPQAEPVHPPVNPLIIPEPIAFQEEREKEEEPAKGTIMDVAETSPKRQATTYNPLSDPDELKKAIIYAEILNRKY